MHFSGYNIISRCNSFSNAKYRYRNQIIGTQTEQNCSAAGTQLNKQESSSAARAQLNQIIGTETEQNRPAAPAQLNKQESSSILY
jgi:hypothetical protein